MVCHVYCHHFHVYCHHAKCITTHDFDAQIRVKINISSITPMIKLVHDQLSI